MELDIYGPQRRADPKLLRRIRAHQSWYRVEVLRAQEWGATPPPNAREMGSILSAKWAEKGVNFTSREALAAYRERRLIGWGVEPYRCEHYLTSSQTLTLNLFAPLGNDLGWLTRVLSALGMAEVGRAENLQIEHQPSLRSAGHLDRTIADAFVGTSYGGVVIETKLADQFSKRKASVGAQEFYELANSKMRIWRGRQSSFEKGAQDQLSRLHALGSLISDVPAHVLFVHHPLDTKSPLGAERYRDVMENPELLHVIDLGRLIDVLRDTARSSRQRSQVDSLYLRYLATGLSDGIFEEMEAVRLSV